MPQIVNPPNGRHDAVFIRKSTEEQCEQGQKSNVLTMLGGIGVTVPKEYWFMGTVGRRKVRANAEFSRLMELVENDSLGTVYVESQDRWGTADRPELFNLLGTLRNHNTRLYDLRAKQDLTARDLATEMLAFINSVKSEQELKDISYRSLRTRVNNFKETGSWPTGPHPFGYGKTCHEADGTLVWVWQPISRTRGQLYYPDPNGELTPSGPADTKITRKRKEQRIVLVPSNNLAFIKAVRIVFDLYTRVGLSRRQISAKLNGEGRRFYAGPFTHPLVTQILTNPAYAGDIHFGKTQTGELHTFNETGEVVPLPANGKKPNGTSVRDVAGRIIKTDMHKTLIDRKTWKLAQEKLGTERCRTSYAPRNPAYYLKQTFVCGHCGKGMAGRTETQPKSKKKTVVYVCSSYVAGCCNGHEVECGYHRIKHDDAERLLMGKIAEYDLDYDVLRSATARFSFETTVTNLHNDDDGAQLEWDDWLTEGVHALTEHLTNSFSCDATEIRRIEHAAKSVYQCGKLVGVRHPDLPLSLSELKQAIRAAEQSAVSKATIRFDQLSNEHRSLTLAWAKASERQQDVLKEEIDRIESDLHKWESRKLSISEHLRKILVAEDQRQAERRQLLAEWPTLESRERGEAFRRLFKTVKLHWDRQFIPARTTPSHPRKTDRPGRYRYTLRRDLTEWGFTTTDSGGSW